MGMADILSLIMLISASMVVIQFFFVCVCVCVYVYCTADNVVDGIVLEVTSTQVPVCVSFKCITDNSGILVIAHHIGDNDGDGGDRDDESEKLFAYI